MQGLTKRQAQTLDYIRKSIEERGYPPTLREIGQHMGIRSTNGVNDHLRALERKGYLRREDMKSRALRLMREASGEPIDGEEGELLASDGGSSLADGAEASLEGQAEALAGFANAAPANDALEIPILGRVAAGLPLLAEENVIDTIRIDPARIRGGSREVFGLRVHGESMIEAGILDGDYIFVRKQPTASRGDIVVALIGDEATVKYFFPEKDYVRFQPANSQMAPILVRAVDFRDTMLLGVVVGLYREY